MADIQTYSFFSVPISIVSFGYSARELNKQLILDSFKEKNKNFGQERSSIGGWQSKTTMEKEYESFNNLGENIKRTIFSTLPKLGFTLEQSEYEKYFNVDSMWVNIHNGDAGFHMPHIHGNGTTLFSGVYYPTSGLSMTMQERAGIDIEKTPQLRASSQPEPGDLILFDPAGDVKRQVIPDYVNRYPYYGSEICITPQQSTLVIFPNYISHMVAPVKDNEYRVSISFSFTKKR